MTEEVKVVVIFLIGLFSAYFGSFSSGGVSAVSIGLMVLFGIPPQMAGITFKLGKIGDNLGGLLLFHKHGYIPKRFILRGGLTMLVGSFIGSYFIITIPDTIMYLGCGLSMFVLAIFSFFRRELEGAVISRKREFLGYFGYFVLSIVGNLFPAGSGVWYYFNNTLILRLSPLEAKGIASVLSFFWFIGTLSGILFAGVYHIVWAIALGFGMLIGGYFGTKHIIKIGNHTLRNILLSTIILFSIYFLYLAFHV